MGNKHINGKDPYIMSSKEAEEEVKSWKENGGRVRYDEENKHSPYPHYHLIDDNPNEDLLIIVDNSLDDKNEDEDGEVSASNDDEEEEE